MKLILSIDVDFDGYTPFDKHFCKFKKRKFDKSLYSLIDYLKNNKYPAVFFIHTSPFIRNHFSNIFFTENEYLSLWENLANDKYEIGIHPHEESEDGKYYFYYFQNYMEKIFKDSLTILKNNNIKVNSIRTGFFSFNEWMIPLCEQYNIDFSFDNMGAYQPFTSTHFENAPLFPYFYDYCDKEKEGSSKVFSIPLGCVYDFTLWDGLIPEASSFEHIKKLWDLILEREDEKYWCCNLLIHSYNFLKHRKKIEKSLEYISQKGEFILTNDVRKKINL